MDRCRCRGQRPSIPAPRFVREITDESPTHPYSRERLPWNPVHWGQMKLLISEIEFLTPFYGDHFHVVYAGAAPGIHMPILAEMFPTMSFTLVDPAPSMIATGDYPTITVMRTYMTNELAQTFKNSHGSNLLLISDIRIGSDDANETHTAMQTRIHRDMELQRGWIDVMQPQSSMLKFRLPWNLGNGKTMYPLGTVLLPVYGKVLTHEARLVVDRGAQDHAYDNSLYEGQMAYFNRVLRIALYPSDDCVRERLKLTARPRETSWDNTRCYDCTAFQTIVGAYLLKSRKFSRSTLQYSTIQAECMFIEDRLTELYHSWNKMRETAAQ